MPRRSLLFPLGVLFVGLAILAGCKKKPVSDDSGSGGSDPASTTGAPPAAVGSDYFVFARLDGKAVRSGTLFAEVKQAFTKAGGAGEWDKIEGEALQNVGLKPTDVDTVTAFVVEAPDRGPPKAVIIVAANKAFDKTPILKNAAKKTADARGFYELDKGELAHFPDEKTFVYVSADLAQKYLDGYAKSRSGWPLTADLTKAAAGHTAFVAVNMSKLPAEARTGDAAKQFGPLLAARTVTVTADLKGKELSIAARAAFADAAAAGQAKDSLKGFIGMANSMVDGMTKGPLPPTAAPFAGAIKEGQRTLKGLQVEAVGSDVTLAGTYKADFDIGQMVADLTKQVRDTAPKITASNNLKQIGLALHACADVNGGRIPVSGIGPKGALLKNASEKPLLSWRVAILPYIEQQNLYRQFKLDEPWDSPNNKKLIETMPKVFAPVGKPGKPGYTNMQMVVGPGAMQPPFAMMPNTFLDGTSNTIAVAEAADAVIWTKPDDVVLPAKLAPGELKKKFGGQFPGGFNVVLWDGSVRFVPDTVSERTLGLAINPNDGQPLGSDW